MFSQAGQQILAEPLLKNEESKDNLVTDLDQISIQELEIPIPSSSGHSALHVLVDKQRADLMMGLLERNLISTKQLLEISDQVLRNVIGRLSQDFGRRFVSSQVESRW